jgi:hypothetical protein
MKLTVLMTYDNEGVEFFGSTDEAQNSHGYSDSEMSDIFEGEIPEEAKTEIELLQEKLAWLYEELRLSLNRVGEK